MALKKMVDIGEKFPVIRKPRLGAPPPADDVLDNVGEPEKQQKAVPSPEAMAPATDRESAPDASSADDNTASEQGRGTAPRRRERQPKRQAHADRSIYGRRYRKSGRTFQFGARVTPEFAEAMRVTAAARNMTMGELLDEMRTIYDSIRALSDERQMAVPEILANIRKS
jgi:hypothetical protein